MRIVVVALEALLLSALILALRGWNHDRVFVGHEVYFTDADCYSRMSRVRLCREHPGTIVRHQDFENYPEGTVSHATAPFDYLILAASLVIAPFSSNSLDLAGAWISPMLALAGGLFLLFWTNQCGFRYRWLALLLYAVSPILVHGTELGRPDHQSFLIVLVIFAVGGEWMLLTRPTRGWGILTGFSWGLALWVSLYEPLILFLLCQFLLLFRRDRKEFEANAVSQKAKWIAFFGVALLDAGLERRLPSIALFEQPLVRNWSHSIGELQSVPLLSAAWFQWGSALLLIAPVVFLVRTIRRPTNEGLLGRSSILLCLLVALVALTMWQARWAYFLIAIFVVALPGLLESVKKSFVVRTLCLLSLWPVASAWDKELWPNGTVAAQRVEETRERIELRELALAMKSGETRPFLAPWWLSPQLAYWSSQPGVAGSSHESFPGILETARFYSATDLAQAVSTLKQRQVSFVLAYDSERVTRTTEKILGTAVSPAAICYPLDRFPAQVGGLLQLLRQNSAGKLYQVVNNR